MSTQSYPYVDCHCHLDVIYQRLGKKYEDSFDDWIGAWPEGFDGCLCTYSDTFDDTMHFL